MKYILHPGYVKSINDGDRHFIGAAALVQLYKVPINECIVAGSFEDQARSRTDGIHLYPRQDGDYALPHLTTPEQTA